MNIRKTPVKWDKKDIQLFVLMEKVSPQSAVLIPTEIAIDWFILVKNNKFHPQQN